MSVSKNKMTPQKSHDLDVSIAANNAAYLRARNTGSTGVCWDVLILTATNERQAAGYRAEIELRHRDIGTTSAFFPTIQRSIVVADSPGPRIGSGGATLNALRQAAAQLNVTPAQLAELRVLLIHSGGLSQRLPAYSPQGKIFSPVPMQRPDGQIATLFDHLYITLAGLPERLGPGTLIVAGDVFLLFDHRQITAPNEHGVTALAMLTAAELGTSHGVFVTDAKAAVQQTLQKADIHTLRAHHAVDSAGRVLLDTGLLFLSPRATEAFAKLAGAGASVGIKQPGLDQRAGVAIDLYDEMCAAMTTGTSRSAFIKAGEKSVRTALWNALHPLGLSAARLDGHFLHLGTTRQFRDTLTGRESAIAAELFSQNVLADLKAKADASSRIFASVVAEGATIAAASVVEHSILGPGIHVGSECVVSQTYATQSKLTLPPQTLLFQVPVTGLNGLSTVQVACGTSDDFKGAFADKQCRFMNASIDVFLDRHALIPDDLWPGIPARKRTLWNARLFPVTAARDAVNELAWMCSQKPASISTLKRWRQSTRLSMHTILDHADAAGLIAHREVVAAHLQVRQLLDAIDTDADAAPETRIAHYVSKEAYYACRTLIETYATSLPDANPSPRQLLRQSRAWWALHQLSRRPGRVLADLTASTAEASFAKIAEASEQASVDIAIIAEPIRLQSGVDITARSPIRIDLAGGWSDTPPYCYDAPGAVVNVALDLDDGPPVRCVVRTLPKKQLILHSIDLGRRDHVTVWNTDEKPDVHDPVAMHKTALRFAGFAPAVGQSVSQWLNKLGCGLEVQTECRVPKGSGLGTSSILAATLLGALYHLRSKHNHSTDQLIADTLLLEQRLGTGGGWQDQVGGIVGGVKLTTSAAGYPQKPVVRQLKIGDALLDGLESRLVVYFSGQQRLARDILRRVMGRWIGREAAMVTLMDHLHRGAVSLADALERGRWSQVNGHIAAYWQTKIDLFAGSTTPSVDLLFSQCRTLYSACGLSGAGGGGFAYFMCRDAKQADKLRDFLTHRSLVPGTMGTVYPTRINRRGIVFT
jgi:fucokinase